MELRSTRKKYFDTKKRTESENQSTDSNLFTRKNDFDIPKKSKCSDGIESRPSNSKSRRRSSKPTPPNRHLSEDWQRDTLPCLLKKYPSPPSELITFKFLMDDSSIFSLVRSGIENMFIDNSALKATILEKLFDIFDTFVTSRWSSFWANYNTTTSEDYLSRLSNEQIYWSWLSEKIVIFYFYSDGDDAIKADVLHKKCIEVKESQLKLDDVKDLISFCMSFSAGSDTDIKTFVTMFEEIDPPMFMV